MKIILTRVNENEKKILYRLLEYSLFEESLNDRNEMNDEGVFEYKYFDTYFNDKTRDAFFVKDEITNKLLGFVMINTFVQKVSNGHSIAEFMIIPKYRMKHIGKEVAKQCFDMYKGNWEVSPSLNSESAYEFWKKVISDYANDEYKFEDRIFSFKNI